MRFLSGIAFIAALTALAQQQTRVESHIVVIGIDGKNPREVYSAPAHFEAPNWSRDGSYLLLNSGGKLYKLPVAGGEPRPVDTGAITRINNDHGISPDGKLFAISAGQIYTLPAEGGTPKQITRATPSYFHGWSPDGKTLVYCAQRDKNFDLYAIAVEGGDERRLTTSQDYDDGPDYSPDAKWIYFNSDRSGSWDIWRIPADGAGADDARAERVTRDDYEDWFPHPSPDGKWLVFVSFQKGTKGHPANQDVKIRAMPLPGATLAAEPDIHEVTRLFGGQGTLNVSSWSPDSSRFAYVWYRKLD